MTAPASLSTAALLLGDGRLPTGAHAHSFGLEAAVGRGLVADVGDLVAWAIGCLHTVWTLEAAAAVLAHGVATAAPDDAGRWTALDAELAARTTSAPGRRTSRTLGRQLLRTGRAAWPGVALETVAGVHPDGPLQPLALGAVVATAGVERDAVALLSLHHALQGVSTAAVRLLGLDPYAVTAACVGLAPALDAVAAAATTAGPDPADLPAGGAPLLDVHLHTHAATERRLFAS
jgi:urease accessory protein